MFKLFAIVLLAVLAVVSAKPAVLAPYAAVTSREFHGASPFYASAYTAGYASPYVASPYVASPYVAAPAAYSAYPYYY